MESIGTAQEPLNTTIPQGRDVGTITFFWHGATNEYNPREDWSISYIIPRL
jgi:hypothetical protein